MNTVDVPAGKQEVVLDCMETQERLLGEIVETGRELGEALHARNWESLEKSMKIFHGLLGSFEGMEEQRQSLLEPLGSNGGTGFESTLDRKSLSRFRNLKSSLRAGLTKVKARMEFFNKYSQARLESTEQFVEKILELKDSGNYDSHGQRSVSGDSRPMLVSHKS